MAQPEGLRAALAVTLLAQMPPLLFMGDEWGSRRPFPLFCDFCGELAEAVRRGREREFAAAYANLANPVPDPLSMETFNAAKLDWDARTIPAHARLLAMVRELLTIRQREITPFFADAANHEACAEGDLILAQWSGPAGRTLHLLANAGGNQTPIDAHLCPTGRAIWGDPPPAILPPWSVFWSVAEA
jgi:1,4-alpha-glucan branching enzyme